MQPRSPGLRNLNDLFGIFFLGGFFGIWFQVRRRSSLSFEAAEKVRFPFFYFSSEMKKNIFRELNMILSFERRPSGQ